MMAKYRGESIPQGWAVDEKGQSVTNAGRALDDRLLTPLGSTRIQSSHKGYGLAAMVEILCSVLSGLRPSHSDLQKEARVGHFFLAIDPGQFRDPQEFQADLDTLMDSLRNCKALKPDQPVLVPGDPECTALAERLKSGIPLPRSVLEELRTVCNAAGVPFLLGNLNT
jgi:LDH2 family malate/lactate/ureidoglycolate dehydrogenase